MRKNVLSVLALSFIAIGSTAFGSGFDCVGEDGYNAKLYNHVDPENGTRTPAALIISNVEEGTLLVRKGGSIRKHNRANTVQYVVDGNRKLAADTAILQIRFKEAVEVLEEGETAEGQLILVADGERNVLDLTCFRYLKTE